MDMTRIYVQPSSNPRPSLVNKLLQSRGWGINRHWQQAPSSTHDPSTIQNDGLAVMKSAPPDAR